MSARVRAVSLLAAAALTGATLTACAAGDQDGHGIAVVIKGLDNPFFQAMAAGIESGAEASGVPVNVQAAKSTADITGQADKLSVLAGQQYSCFIVNPITGNNLVQGLSRVSKAGIPIVNIDQPLNPEAVEAAELDVSTYIGTDNVAAGRLAGERMIELLGGSGTVAVIAGIGGDKTSNDRVQGFTEAVADKLTVLPAVSADWERQKALTTATDLMTAHPDLSGIFAANDDMGLGAARAVANARKQQAIKVISLDGNKDALEAVRNGELSATIAQYPYAIGELGVQACQGAIAGRDIPESVEAPVAVITPENAEDALAKFPQPFQPYRNPLAASVK